MSYKIVAVFKGDMKGIHAVCTVIIKETPVCSCFPVSSAEFLRIPFFQNNTERVFLNLHKSNKYKKVSFLLTVFTEKVRKKKANKPSGSKTGKY